MEKWGFLIGRFDPDKTARSRKAARIITLHTKYPVTAIFFLRFNLREFTFFPFIGPRQVLKLTINRLTSSDDADLLSCPGNYTLFAANKIPSFNPRSSVGRKRRILSRATGEVSGFFEWYTIYRGARIGSRRSREPLLVENDVIVWFRTSHSMDLSIVTG